MTSRIVMLPLRRLLGQRRLLVASMLLPAGALAVLPFGGSGIGQLVVAVALVGFGLGLGQPLTISWLATQSPEEVRGTAISVRLTANRFGQLALPAGVGVIAGVADVTAIFWSLGVLLVVAAVFVARAKFEPAVAAPPPLAAEGRAPP